MDESKMMACSCKPYNEFEETVQMMLSEDYKARFVAEYRQTKIRYERLKKFCNRIEAAYRSNSKVEMPKHDCELELHCSFGQITLLVPKKFTVMADNSTAFAAVEVEGCPNENPEGVIRLDNSCSFGEIEIKYI